jgi:hypothetical protein
MIPAVVLTQRLFLPALGKNGEAIEFDAYAIYVYRPLANKRSNE